MSQGEAYYVLNGGKSKGNKETMKGLFYFFKFSIYNVFIIKCIFASFLMTFDIIVRLITEKLRK